MLYFLPRLISTSALSCKTGNTEVTCRSFQYNVVCCFGNRRKTCQNLSPVRLLFIHKTIKCMDTISNSHQTCTGLHLLSQQNMFCCLFPVFARSRETRNYTTFQLLIFKKKLETLLPKTIKIQLCLFDLLLKTLEILFYETHTHTLV